MEIGQELQKFNEDDLLVSYDFKSFYPSAQVDINSSWPKLKTADLFKKGLNESICIFFNSAKWNELNRSALLAVKYDNPENLVSQNLPIKEKNDNPDKNIRLEEITE